MSDPSEPREGWAELNTRLTRVGRPHHGTGFVNAPVERGSTVLYPSMDALREAWDGRYRGQLSYGATGNPTQHLLEEAIAEIEGGAHCQVVVSGLAAVTTPLLAFLGAGGHCLMPDSVYGPTRRFCDTLLRRMGIETTYYRPMIDAAGLEALIRPSTQVLFTESPGSHTFEVQDIPALAAVAHAHGVKVLLDNTWGVHVFQPFRHGVDVSIQALTKYPSGHADVILGAITLADEDDWRTLRDCAIQLGQCASPDDCWLTLRGLRSMGVRLAQQSRSALEIARWLAARPEVARVLHPALPDCPGHAVWKRDFTGASSLFGVEFASAFTDAGVDAMVGSFGLFSLGESWGGYESLALPSRSPASRTHPTDHAGPLCRFHVGLEHPAELIADLEGGLRVLREASA